MSRIKVFKDLKFIAVSFVCKDVELEKDTQTLMPKIGQNSDRGFRSYKF